MLCLFSVDLKHGGNTVYNIDQGISNWGPGTSRGPQGSDPWKCLEKKNKRKKVMDNK